MLLSIAVGGTQIKTLGIRKVIYLPHALGLQLRVSIVDAANVARRSQRGKKMFLHHFGPSPIQPAPQSLLMSAQWRAATSTLLCTSDWPKITPGSRRLVEVYCGPSLSHLYCETVA